MPKIRDVSPLDFPHSHQGDLIAEELGVSIETGLSGDEASRRLKEHGENRIAKTELAAWWSVFLRQFSSIVIWLLFAAAIVSWLTNGVPQAIAILTVLLINAVIGFVIEWRAGRALDALRNETLTYARVRRDGYESVVESSELVIGDIIALTAGDRVPADARLLEAANIQADESALTGESVPVEKTIDSVLFSSILSERRSMLYLGTMVVAGRGLAIVTATGIQTEIGRVGQLIAKTESAKTPLERRLEALGRTLVYLVLAIGAVVFALGLLRGDGAALMLEVAISLAVAAVPEALPAMTTLILAMGVLRMAKSRALVRKLSAVETLGSTTVICTDKTGTLTENRMSVEEYSLSNGQIVRLENGDMCEGLLRRFLEASVLCNDAAPGAPSTDDHLVGDPTETALLVGAQHFQMDIPAERSRFDKVREIPFDTASKRMIVALREKQDGHYVAVCKGAPKVVLDMCTHKITKASELSLLETGTREHIVKTNNGMAARGLRVLAVADKSIKSDSDDLENGYVFLGLAGMSDQPRVGVARAIRSAQTAGIRVIMLTGDQTMTARAIAEDLDLGHGQEISALHASEIAEADDATLELATRRAHVFARVSPADKLRIVETLQKAGEIVAVTGDGINDAPALKRADIGIAMGGRGTEVAKEAADIVLTDDNFSTLIAAIEGGRTIYANIIKFVHFMFAKNLAEVLVIFAAMLAGLPLPLLPLQILWVNLVTDSFLAFALAVEPSSGETMRHAPRPPGEALVSRPFLILIAWQGVMLAAITLSAYIWALREYGEGPHARTIALLALVGVQLGHLFNCRSRVRSVFENFFRNPYMFISVALAAALQLVAVYFTTLSKVLDLVEPDSRDLLVTLGCIISPIAVVEITKLLLRPRTALEN